MVIIKNIGVDNRCERPIEFLVGKYYAEYLINDKDINFRKSVFGGYIHLLEKTGFPVHVYNGQWDAGATFKRKNSCNVKLPQESKAWYVMDS